MEQLRLGKTGLQVSRLCLGMMSYHAGGKPRPWMLDQAAAEPIIRRAVEGGITFFDTADMYSHGGSEIATGKLIGKLFTRDDVVLATKVFFPMSESPNGRGLSRKHILSAIDASLGRLGMDYVDLYQIHRWDPDTPIEETMGALHDVVRAGKYREEEREMIPLCIDQGLGVLPWSPLARGVLAGTRTRDGERRTTRSENDAYADELYGRQEDFDVVERVAEVASERGVPPARIALTWLLHKPGVTAPIIGATKLEHLEDALAAAELALSSEEISRLEEPYRTHPVLGHH